MTKQRNDVPYGATKAGAMREMSPAARLDFIAAGVPVILSSARSFWSAAENLSGNPRDAAVLEGFAEEESAKALILLIWCVAPPPRQKGRISRIIRNFYNHLAQLIYAKVQSWRPVHIRQLQEYVTSGLQGHYLEGGIGEFILPNWAIYTRESTLFAEVEQHEDDVLVWNDPTRVFSTGMNMRPTSPRLVEALAAVRFF